MATKLPKDVVDFLSNNPNELQHVRDRMSDVEELRMHPIRQAEERERRAKLPLKPCRGLLGKNECGNQTPGGFYCVDCNAEFSSDPEAYK